MDYLIPGPRVPRVSFEVWDSNDRGALHRANFARRSLIIDTPSRASI